MQANRKSKFSKKLIKYTIVLAFIFFSAYMALSEDKFYYMPSQDLYERVKTTSSSSTTTTEEEIIIENLCPTPCELIPVEDKDFAILIAMTTGDKEVLDRLPVYLRNALFRNTASSNPDEKIDINQLLKYINYSDLTNVILYLYENCLAKNSFFQRHHFIEELLNVKYLPSGIPARDKNGGLTLYFEPSLWMKEVHIDKVNILRTIDNLLLGLENKDPRVRLQCLKILYEMGPMPHIRDRIRYAGGLVEGGLETVGNAEYGYFSTQKLLLTRRYCYCDIDGLHKAAVPFLEFAQYDREIKRLLLTYDIEISGRLQEDDFRVMDIGTFLTLTDQITLLGYYGVDRVTVYQLAQKVYPRESIELSNPNGSELIPINRYLQMKSSYKYLVKRVLINEGPALSLSFMKKDEFKSKHISKLIRYFIAAMENANYSVRLNSAHFLYDLFKSHMTTDVQKEIILNYTLKSRILREVMKSEYVVQKYEEKLQKYLGHEDFDQLKDDIIKSNKYLSDEELLEYYRKFRPKKEVDRPKIKRTRNDDGTPIK